MAGGGNISIQYDFLDTVQDTSSDESEMNCPEEFFQQIKETATAGVITYIGELLEKYIQKWGTVDIPFLDEVDRFILAVAANDEDMVRQLLQQGVDPNSCWDGGFTPLICASYFGHLAMVNALLSLNHSRDPVDEKRRRIGTQDQGGAETVSEAVHVVHQRYRVKIDGSTKSGGRP